MICILSYLNQSIDKLVAIRKKLAEKLTKVPGGKYTLVVSMLAVVAVVGVFFALSKCAVVWDGEIVVVAENRDIAETAVAVYLDKLEESVGAPVKMNEDTIEYRTVLRLQAAPKAKEIQNILTDQLNCQYEASGIFVNGERAVVLKNEAASQKVLDTLLETYSRKDQDEQFFKQQVSVETVTVSGYELMNIDQAIEYIRSGGVSTSKYKIKSGDTLWDIALAADLQVEDLLAANPDLNPDNMQIDQEITIATSVALIDVVTIYENMQKETIEFRVQERKDPDLYLGEQKLVQEGSDGLKEILYRITTKNGRETEKKVAEEKIIKEAVPQIIARGEKKLLAYRGGNTRLEYPSVGSLTSYFGMRWGRMHEGVDIGASYGSPVVAAEAGTVIRSSNYSGYGLCIDIDHGSGVITRYAHLSSTGVDNGQYVERGQFIGRSGNSGNSTGPHLHFEVLINGSPQDPTKFI